MAESTAKTFSGYPFGTSRKKASAIFYNTALKNISRLLCGTAQKNLKKQRRNAVPKKGLPVLWGIHIFNEHNAITSKNTNWPLSGRLCYSLWLFHLHSALKIQPFSPIFPLAGATAKAFFCLSLWNFKKKTSTIFYNTAFRKHQKNECPAQLAPSLLPPFFVTKAVRHCFAPPERFSRLLPWCPRRGAGDFRIPRDT